MINLLNGYAIAFEDVSPADHDWQSDLEEMVNSSQGKFRWLRDRGAFTTELRIVSS